jgi:sentrin-specific protease 1
VRKPKLFEYAQLIACRFRPRPPKPYAPSYDDLLEQRRLKDERINQRLRPKAVPLPTSLPPADDAEVTALLKKSGVIAKVARETVSSSDIARLRPGQWLNDEIINFYGALITARAEEKDKKESLRGKPLSVHCFSTFFWPKLCDDGYEQGRLAKWTKKVSCYVNEEYADSQCA